MFATVPPHWLDDLLRWATTLAPSGTFFSHHFNLHALLALVLVSLSCGAVGSLVVGGRMAFFSDALAHCAFAGVSIGFVIFKLALPGQRTPQEFWSLVTPVMLAFGMLVGAGIAYLRERTGLASDTVIGVFFAASIGLAAMIAKVMKSRDLFRLEEFLFGNPILVEGRELVWLAGLVVATTAVMFVIYNQLLLAGFNSSLALSRRVRLRVVNYVFIILLALIVNLCVRTVGVLLINALLVVPAATAANLGRNLRQVFWLTMGLTLFASVAGQLISWEVEIRSSVELGIPGTIILVSVLVFAVSAVIGPMLRRRRAVA